MDFAVFAADCKEWVSAYQEGSRKAGSQIRMQTTSILGYQGKAT